jgi:serine/threonine protein kinase
MFEDDHSVYAVLEFQPQGTLMTVLENPTSGQMKRFSEQHTRVIVEQILLALDFFQRKKIVHRDIKLENILISSVQDRSEYDIRIADFGLAIIT